MIHYVQRKSRNQPYSVVESQVLAQVKFLLIFSNFSRNLAVMLVIFVFVVLNYEDLPMLAFS